LVAAVPAGVLFDKGRPTGLSSTSPTGAGGIVHAMKPFTIDKSLARVLAVAVWILIFAGGGFLLFRGIDHESLWYDESYSLAAAAHPIGEIIPLIGSDSHPPLYFIMLRAFTLVFGRSEAAARSLSALGILALAGLGLFPLSRRWGQARAMLFSALVFLTPMSVVMGQEARMYSWTAFFVTAALLAAWGWWKSGGIPRLVAFGILSLAAAYCHYYGLLAVAFIWLIAVIGALAAKRRALVELLIAGVAVIAMYAPWLVKLAAQAGRVSKNYWIGPITKATVMNTLAYPFGFKFNVPPGAATLFWICCGVIVLGFVLSIAKKESDAVPAAAAVLVYALTLGSALLLSALIRPILVERYMVSCMGLFILALAWGATSIKFKPAWLILLGGYAWLCLPVIQRVHTERFNGPMYEVRDAMVPAVKPGDVFIHGSEHTLGTFCYYFPNNKHYLYLPEGFVPFSNYGMFAPAGSSGSDLAQFRRELGTVWVVSRSGEYYSMDASAITASRYRVLSTPLRRFSMPSSWFDVTIAGYGYRRQEESAQDGVVLEVDLTGLLSDSGRLGYALFQAGPLSLPAKPDTVELFVETGEPELRIGGLKPGTYALVVFQDENSNGWRDPHERVGFSGGAAGSAEDPPAFKDAAFELKAGGTRIQIRLR